MILGTIVKQNANIPLGFVKSLIPVVNYGLIIEEGLYLSKNRNNVCKQALIEKQDLLFIDSDMVFTPEDVKKMEEHLKTHDIVTGVYVAGFKDFPLAVYDKDLKPVELQDEMFEVGACGAGFLGISLKALQGIRKHFYEFDGYGEDISFCIKAREEGYKIHCDPTIQLGHIKQVTKYYETSNSNT